MNPLVAIENPMNYVQMLTRYKAWADDVFLSVVSTVPITELAAPRPIIFGSLIRTLNHSYAMDHVWQSHLLGKPHGLTTRNPEHCPGYGTTRQIPTRNRRLVCRLRQLTPGITTE